jgi:hypothetical protein
MEQMNMDKLDVVSIDYQQADFPESVRKLKPIVYKDGDSFCCLLGPDPQEGVFGCGQTAEKALADWDVHAKDRAINHPYGDELAAFIVRQLAKNLTDI